MNRDVTIRELRNQGGQVLARVSQGEVLTVTRNGEPITQLSPLARAPLPATTLLARWQRLPALDPDTFKADIDDVLDARL
ncbi:MAG: type II toxin-antitoxin system prevent-host-death family antitoxin [Salinisphaeraceae bacterium]|uniref:Type II toxin-antitoxin system prevent-host-death family antitoxin n=2 Tax=Spectribacter TaxID=3160928 RepID=A0ABU3C2J9_9GAMM|nr:MULTISPECIES: type II toxin-antitoxin system prevent-host-death family antitoxin [unclassified Salinisphaera]MDT0618380.1 type II toxin-antitoxin system prevent-host-death family antitoxin [Salinisphaera sp. P385]MDT0635750.1 type II toxin-antitoxin system prevent-host-death family antitoxin [Salinisphaera sp. W335]